MESGAISDAQLSASSQYNTNSDSASRARLNSKQQWKRGSWSSLKNDLNQWIQVDLGSYTKVTRVATQGNSYRSTQWVKKYKIQYSVDGLVFQFYEEPGNDSAKVSDAKVFVSLTHLSGGSVFVINSKGR